MSSDLPWERDFWAPKMLRRWLMALHVQSCGTQEGMWSSSGRHALMGALDNIW